jgi:RNA polymerase sigma factor
MPNTNEHLAILRAIQEGDDKARQDLIAQYAPLVVKLASKITGRYIEPGRDEEVSIGLMALNEAIDKYDPSRGASFLSFAHLVISNRIKDYLRSRKTRELPSSALSEQAAVLDYRQSWIDYREADHRENRRSEVVQFIQELAVYKLDLRQLAAATPKHRQARQRAFEAVQLLAASPDLARHVKAKKELPLKEMESQLNVSRKTIERQRRYIIALFIIVTGDYSYLSEYLPGGGTN